MTMTIAEAIAEVKAPPFGEPAPHWSRDDFEAYWISSLDRKFTAAALALQAVASGDLIPKTDAEMAVALAYQLAADQVSMSAPGRWLVVETDRVKAAILALAPAEALAEVQALKAERDRLTTCLEAANRNHEHFEREWYLAKDRAEAAEAEAARLKAALMDISDPKRLTSHGDPVVLRDRARAELTTPEKDTP